MDVEGPKTLAAYRVRKRNLAAAGLVSAVVGIVLSWYQILVDSLVPRILVVGGAGLLVVNGLLWRLALPDPGAVDDPPTHTVLARHGRVARVARYGFRMGAASLLVSLVGMTMAPIPLGQTFGYTNPEWAAAAGISFGIIHVALPVSLWANAREANGEANSHAG